MVIIYFGENLKARDFARWLMGFGILGNGLPRDYKKFDARVKDILSSAKPNGDLARQLLLDYREMKESFIDF